MTTTSEVLDQLRSFVAERNWHQFHSPKNLAAGLAIEACEVQEIFLWTEDEASRRLNERDLARLREEIGDVQLYLLNLADQFGLDPLDCALSKLATNRSKYPAGKVWGSARKYDEY